MISRVSLAAPVRNVVGEVQSLGSGIACQKGEAGTTSLRDTDRFLPPTIAGKRLEAPAPGFPKDFPELIDAGGSGKGQRIGGFGGDATLDRDGHRKVVTRNPVILIHGNGAHSLDPTWGMTVLRDRLKAAGYKDAEIWALDYLGANNTSASFPTPTVENIEDVRRFADQVREYLGVEKVDIICHSLGANLARAYLTGLQSDGTWDASDHRMNSVGTLVTLAAGNYGLGRFSIGEFKTGSPLERGLHEFDGVKDDTPHGSTTPPPPHDDTSRLDDNSHVYGAFWAEDDFVERQNRGTGRLEGAHVNEGFLYEGESAIRRHELILKDAAVFDEVLPLLNQRRGGNGGTKR